jgi:hypothetical protein
MREWSKVEWYWGRVEMIAVAETRRQEMIIRAIPRVVDHPVSAKAVMVERKGWTGNVGRTRPER